MNYLYRFLNCYGDIIYIGKTTQDLDRRMNQHFGKKGHLPKECLKSVARIEYKPVDIMVNVEYLEKQLIQYVQPKYNTIWKGEKSDYIPDQHLEGWRTYKDIIPLRLPEPNASLQPQSAGLLCNMPKPPYKWDWIDNVFMVAFFLLAVWIMYGFYELFIFLADKW